jgi:hypothetical protein
MFIKFGYDEDNDVVFYIFGISFVRYKNSCIWSFGNRITSTELQVKKG